MSRRIKGNTGTIYRVCRLCKGLSEKEVAEQLDVPFITYHKVETGENIPRLPLMLKIARILDIDELERAAAICLYAKEKDFELDEFDI
jgi:transcriptional regulator with XRE-family HTH domain